jgi:DNA-binding response OmpR family regulator
MMNVKVLYIEDEPFLGRIVSETLIQQGFDLQLITDGAKVIEGLISYVPDICVLDIMLPNVDGFTLCREIRAKRPTLPIIFLTALSETSDLVKGFDAGGTDYIRKPFSMEELIARINNQINLLSHRLNLNAEIQSLGKYKLNRARYQLTSPTTTSKLSGREMEIISLLANNINKVVDRKDLLKKVWGDDSFFNSRTLDVYVRKLRSMFAEDQDIEIVTLKGKGYLFLLK